MLHTNSLLRATLAAMLLAAALAGCGGSGDSSSPSANSVATNSKSPASAVVTPSATATATTAASPTPGASSSSSSGASSSSSSGASSSSSSSSGSGSSSGSSSGTAATGNGTAAGLLSYLNGLSGQTKHVLSGQHTSLWDSNPLDYQQAAASQTGKTVAILGISSGAVGSNENTVSLSNAWLAQGGIPLVSWWPSDPFTGQYDNDRSIDFAQLTQPGTAAYVAWYKELDGQIALLKQINGPVLYRPFVEMNGTWFWWGGQQTTDMVTVQQQMHDYFVSKGVTNVLWVYNVNAGSGNYSQYYAGSAYVDVVSWDAYPPTAGDPTYPALAALGKPIMLGETGVESPNNNAVAPNSGDNGQLLATVEANFPKVVAVVIWCQNWALSEQNGAAAYMNNPSTIALSDLPSGLVDP
jgi:hypothetical protein